MGSGAGYSGDRIEPAVELAEKGDLDYLVFECLAERTIALAQQARMKIRTAATTRSSRSGCARCCRLQGQGHQDRHQHGRRQPGRRRAQDRGDRQSLGLSALKIAAVIGDDVLDACKAGDLPIMERRHDPAARQPAGLGQRLSRRRADGAGAGSGRRYRHHRPRVRSGAVPGAADPCLRLGDGRLESARAGDGRRAPAGMRRPDHRRLFRRSRLQGRARIWRGSAFRSARSARTAASSSPRLRARAAR